MVNPLGSPASARSFLARRGIVRVAELGRHLEADVGERPREPIGNRSGLGESGEDRLGHLLPVDGEVERLAHPAVLHRQLVPRLDPPVVDVGVVLPEMDREPVGLHLAQPFARKIDDVRLALAQHGQARRLLGHEAIHERLVLRRAHPPMRVDGLELQVRAGDALGHPVGTAAHGVGGEVLLALGLDVLLGQDHALRREGPRQIGRDDEGRLLGDDHHPVGRRRLDLRDERAQRSGVAGRRARAQRALEAPLHVLGSELVAVVELDAFAEVERPACLVGVGLPAGGDAGVLRELAVGRDADQVVEDLGEVELDDVTAERGIKRLAGEARERDGQLPRRLRPVRAPETRRERSRQGRRPSGTLRARIASSDDLLFAGLPPLPQRERVGVRVWWSAAIVRLPPPLTLPSPQGGEG